MKLLVMRFSALGDVAMTVPVIDSLARSHPHADITVLTRAHYAPFFRSLPPNAHVRAVDLHAYRGPWGLCRLSRELKREGFTHIVDLHDVLRTKWIRGYFRLRGVPVVVIDKGRKEKRRLTRRRSKQLIPLPTTFERYRRTLSRLGLSFEPSFCSIFPGGRADLSPLLPMVGKKGTTRWVGIAPFAKHKGKVYPYIQMERIISRLRHVGEVRIFLFGGGRQEKKTAELWASTYRGVTSVVGCVSMEQELALMSHMDVMLTMDSGNMHLASLVGVPVVSVWGATHPYAGFLGWGQTPSNAVQADLRCRPCSVYGQKPCFRGDYACMRRIPPEEIMERLIPYLR